jgi:hypothetical protein
LQQSIAKAPAVDPNRSSHVVTGNTTLEAFASDCAPGKGCRPIWTATIGASKYGADLVAGDGVVAVTQERRSKVLSVFSAACGSRGSRRTPSWVTNHVGWMTHHGG